MLFNRMMTRCVAPVGASVAITLVLSTPFNAIAAVVLLAKSESIAPPATKLKTAALVSPAAGRSYFGSASTHTRGLSLATTPTPEITALAKSLLGDRNVSVVAERDGFTRNVFDYVRNNIKVEFRYGLSKGGAGALIDQSGTPFDQAELMVMLLDQGGVQANYVAGEATVTPSQFGLWTGLVETLNEPAQTFTVNAKAACELLADGGIPATVGSATSCDGLAGALSANLTMSHVWVQVAGVNYDPAYKVHVLRNGIDLPAAMGCGTQSASSCGSTVSNAGMSGASQGTTAGGIPFVANYNLTAAKTTHDTLKTNLATYIKNQNIRGQGLTASVFDVLGGKDLQPQLETLELAPLSYGASVVLAGAMPDQYRTKLRVKTDATTCGAFFADEIAGRSLVYKRNLLYTTEAFAIDGQVLAGLAYAPAGGCSAVAAPYVQIEVDHPYAANGGTYADELVNFKSVDPPSDETGGSRRARPSYLYYDGGIGVSPRTYVSGQQYATDWPEQNYLSIAPVTIVHGFGQAGMSAQKYMSDLTSVITPPQEQCGITTVNTRPAYRECNYGEHAVVAETFASMRTLTDQLVDGVAKTVTTRHHDIGLVYAGRASGMSMMTIQESLSIAAASGSAPAKQAAFDMTSLALSEAESRANAIDAAPGISAARAFFVKDFVTTLSGTAGKIYDIAPSQMAAYVAALPHQAKVTQPDGSASYGSYCINYVSSTGSSVAAPGCWRHLALQDVANQGYSTLIMEGGLGELFYNGGGERAFTMWEYVKGGTTIGDGLATAIKTTELIDQAAPRRKFLTVSPSSGDLSYSAGADIVTGVGDFPNSLPFTRSFAPSAKEKGRNTSSYYYNDGGGLNSIESTAAVTSGADSQYHDRLGGGWTHNYQVRMVRSNDLSYQLGSENAFFASEFIANLQIIKDLGTTGALPAKLGSIFAINNMDRSLAGYAGGTFNTISVMKGTSSTVFHQMPNQTWVSGAEPEATLDATLKIYTSRNGEVITFSPYRFNEATVDGPTNTLVGSAANYDSYKILKADQWTFPSGLAVKFQYDPIVLSDPPGCPPNGGAVQYAGQYGYLLRKVSNSFGRELNFDYDRQWTRQTIGEPCRPTFEQGVIYPGYAYTAVSFYTYRLKSVTDENQRAVTFSIAGGAINGDSFSVTAPVKAGVTATTRYEYSPSTDSPDAPILRRKDYQLRRWFSPGAPSTPYQVVRYDTLNRASRVTDRNGVALKYYSSGLFGSELWKRFELVDGLGYVSLQTFDEKNGTILDRDALGAVTRKTYDSSGRLVRVVSPELNAQEIAYDARGNVVSKCEISKARAGLACDESQGDLVTRTTYWEGPAAVSCANLKVCNSPYTETDPRLGLTTYSWDTATGELTQKLSPTVGTTRPQIDLGYTAYTANGSTFSLLTSKTEKVSASQNLVTNYEYDAANHFVLKAAITDPGGKNIRTCLKFDALGNLIQTTDPRAGACS